MRFIFTFVLFIGCCAVIHAQQLSGTVKDDQNNSLPFSSILVKNTPIGVTANNEGRFQLNLKPGTYTIICQHIGYAKSERTITLKGSDTLEFRLITQQLNLNEVVIKKEEDPAYEIIRHAIKARVSHQQELKNFSCEVYIKGQLRLRDYPKKFFGKKVDFEDGDTSKMKILFLSETVATYAKEHPDKERIEVLSTKVSGQRNGYGFSSPQFISFYENNVNIGEGLNPRGFISPISSNALHYYKYKYEGCFWEDGKMISQIKVIPKRGYEPLFSGHINIVEDEWRIHSVDLQLTKASQMQLFDTLNIQQLYAPYNKDVWTIRSQVIYPSIKILGFDAYGNFVSVYSKFDVNPPFKKGFFNNTILKYDTGSNKRATAYWDTIRPFPLATEELVDYRKKDSLEIAHKDPKYLDSLDHIRNKQSPFDMLLGGLSYSDSKRNTYYTFSPLINGVGVNTVEGWNLQETMSYRKKIGEKKWLTLSPSIRYGFSNHHFNGMLYSSYSYRRKSGSTYFSLSGGRYVYQFDNADPISPLINSIYTLLAERNYMKVYEAWFANAGFGRTLDNGLSFRVSASYQDRYPLKNTDTTIRIKNYDNRNFTPNYPVNLVSSNFTRHQALSVTFGVTYKAGAKYVEYPDSKYSLGSKYPTFSASYTKGIQNVFGSDVHYDKWRFSISDNINLKIGGLFSYRLVAGGFLNNKKVEIQDYSHINGDQTIFATTYLGSFQLAPYYKYSNTASLYAKGFVEHHFNGLLTNKIPLFRKLNWFLVGGGNALYLPDGSNYYIEAFGGLENILKIIRVDYVAGFQKNGPTLNGIRIGLKLGSLVGE